jgi:hypothetical protein
MIINATVLGPLVSQSVVMGDSTTMTALYPGRRSVVAGTVANEDGIDRSFRKQPREGVVVTRYHRELAVLGFGG